ncbi:hypothetical protein SEA_BUDSKI_58 [Gordonia phage Budski]|nr:hypothetical protein SEA_BUDSKI_58 [Gordonia phage Budski]
MTETYGLVPAFLYSVAKLIGGEKVPPINRVFLTEEQADTRNRLCPLCAHRGHLDRTCRQCNCSAEGRLADA